MVFQKKVILLILTLSTTASASPLSLEFWCARQTQREGFKQISVLNGAESHLIRAGEAHSTGLSDRFEPTSISLSEIGGIRGSQGEKFFSLTATHGNSSDTRILFKDLKTGSISTIEMNTGKKLHDGIPHLLIAGDLRNSQIACEIRTTPFKVRIIDDTVSYQVIETSSEN